MLKEFAEDIWCFEQPQKFLGLELGTRMTVVKLSDSSLFVHSPIRPTDDVLQKVKELGEVKYIVAPNLFHHLYAGDFQKAFPQAELYGAPKLDRKRKDLNFNVILSDETRYPWSDEISHQFIEGAPLCNEVMFCVKSSKTLLITDIGLHICEDSPFMTRLFFKLLGGYNKFGISNAEKKIFVKNEESFQNSISQVLSWDFDKIMLTHGVPISEGGKSQFSRAFATSKDK